MTTTIFLPKYIPRIMPKRFRARKRKNLRRMNFQTLRGKSCAFTKCKMSVVATKSAFVNVVCADVHGHDAIAFDEKHGAQVAFNVHGVNCLAVAGGEPVNFVYAEARVKR